MPQITLTRNDAIKLHAFCVEHKQDRFFLAKDHGAYVGSAANGKNCIFYFRGCNPNKDQDFYENAWAMFGGDDFGEHLPLSWLKTVADRPEIGKVTIVVNKASIRCKYAR